MVDTEAQYTENFTYHVVQQPRPVMSQDNVFKRAAEAIVGADYLLFHVGAGMSADSGLGVFKDVDEMKELMSRDLTYYDICQPGNILEEFRDKLCLTFLSIGFLRSKPNIFFWLFGQSYDKYVETEPHEGHHIIKKWTASKVNFGEKSTKNLPRKKASSVFSERQS